MVLLGLSTLTVAAAPANVTTPFHVVLNGLAPNVRVLEGLVTLIGLARVRAAMSPINLVPSPLTSRVPTPSGPEPTVAPTVLGVESAAYPIEPAERLIPVEPTAPKVFWASNTSAVEPSLVIEFAAPAPLMTPESTKPLGDKPLVVIVRAPPPKSTNPEIVGVKARLSLLETMEPVKPNTPAAAPPATPGPPAMIAGPPPVTVRVNPPAVPVAFADMVKCVASVMLVITVPPGMLLPLTAWPTASPIVLAGAARVMELLALVVVELVNAFAIATAALFSPPELLKVSVPAMVLLPK